MRADHQDVGSQQLFPQRIAVVAQIEDEPQWTLWTAIAVDDADGVQGWLCQLYFGGRCGGNLASQRNTLAVDHHHPLCALATLGFANPGAPFLPGAKLPSMKHSVQSKVACSSNSERNARHRRSQMPCSSHWTKRFQQVLPLIPNSRGTSRQRAPVRNTQRIPRNTARLSLRGRPRRERLRLGFGSNGSIFFHCESVSNVCRTDIISQKAVRGTMAKLL